jgi:hypothetical protein
MTFQELLNSPVFFNTFMKNDVFFNSLKDKFPEILADLTSSRNNPNCDIELTYEKDGNEKTIILPPYDMVIDQNRVDEGEMSINRFTTKWFGKISKSKLKQIEKEIAKEFYRVLKGKIELSKV